MESNIATNIRRIRTTIPAGVQYVVVSKYRPVEELQAAYDAGERVFAESRPVELAAKVPQLPSDINWHFIGHLQTNKLKLVLPHCSLIQSVDSVHLMEAIERFAAASGMQVNILVEVHIGQEESKQGFTPQETMQFFTDREFERFPHINFCGLMGMASNTDDEAVIEGDFARIHELFSKISELPHCPAQFKELSIGMSQDYVLALRHGATMVRIGSATFM